jgi:hypothetical protein
VAETLLAYGQTDDDQTEEAGAATSERLLG